MCGSQGGVLELAGVWQECVLGEDSVGLSIPTALGGAEGV